MAIIQGSRMLPGGVIKKTFKIKREMGAEDAITARFDKPRPWFLGSTTRTDGLTTYDFVSTRTKNLGPAARKNPPFGKQRKRDKKRAR